MGTNGATGLWVVGQLAKELTTTSADFFFAIVAADMGWCYELTTLA